MYSNEKNRHSTGASHFRTAFWRRGPFEERLVVFSVRFVKALGAFKALHTYCHGNQSDAKWESLTLRVIHAPICCTVKTNFCSLHSLTTKQ